MDHTHSAEKGVWLAGTQIQLFMDSMSATSKGACMTMSYVPSERETVAIPIFDYYWTLLVATQIRFNFPCLLVQPRHFRSNTHVHTHTTRTRTHSQDCPIFYTRKKAIGARQDDKAFLS